MDFGAISGRSTKSSMKRKQSNSLLTAFRKSSQPPTSYIPPASTTSSHFPEPQSPYSESTSSHSNTQPTYNDYPPNSATGSGGTRYAESMASSSRTAVGSTEGPGTFPVFGRGGAGRAVSGSSMRVGGGYAGSIAGSSAQGGSGEKREKDRDREKSSGGATARRPEDMIRVVKDRLFSWSYMMQWYAGDMHWFNTVKIPRTTTESYLGPKALESRARNFFILGISLGLVFDITNAGDFLKGVNKVLEEWETMVEGGGSKVRGIFKGQKGNRKSATGAGYMGMQDSDSALMQVNLPFTLDFFQVHSTTCSLIRDIYRKILRFFLPSRVNFIPPTPDPNAVLHPSTIIYSAPIDTFNTAPSYSRSNSDNLRSPSTRSASSASHTPGGFGFGTPSRNDGDDIALSMEQAFLTTNATPRSGTREPSAPNEGEYDAFQAHILGELGPDRMLVGDGQAMTKEVMDLFTKVDAKLRKHFSNLLRETDLLARRVLDDELNALMMSLNPGSNPLSFDYQAALSNTGNGFALGTRSGSSIRESRSRPGSAGNTSSGGGGHMMGQGEMVPPLPIGAYQSRELQRPRTSDG